VLERITNEHEARSGAERTRRNTIDRASAARGQLKNGWKVDVFITPCDFGDVKLRRSACVVRALQPHPACHDICSVMARGVVLLIAGIVLASCTSGGTLGDLMPHWTGGLPKNAPPRPGTPEYDAFREQAEAEAARDKSKERSQAAAKPEQKDSAR
jgi:hypothetical protein